jgi:hypothetical protein
MEIEDAGPRRHTLQRALKRQLNDTEAQDPRHIVREGQEGGLQDVELQAPPKKQRIEGRPRCQCCSAAECTHQA